MVPKSLSHNSLSNIEIKGLIKYLRNTYTAINMLMKRARFDQKRREIMKQQPTIAIDAEMFSAKKSRVINGISSPNIKKKLMSRFLVVMNFNNFTH